MKTILYIFILLISFRVLSANYYVNDNSTSGDIFCTAVGASGNNGTSASTPKATLSQILAAYTLSTNDIVYVDKGTYTTDKGLSSGVASFKFSGGFSIIGAGNTKTIFDISGTAIASKSYFMKITCSSANSVSPFSVSNQTIVIKDVAFKGYNSTTANTGSVIYFAGNNGGGTGNSLTLTNVLFTQNGYSTTAYPVLYISGYTTFNMSGGGFTCNGSSTSNYNGGGIMIDGTNNTVTSTLTNVAFINNFGSYTGSATQQRSSMINLNANSPTSQGGNSSISLTNCLFDGNSLSQDASWGCPTCGGSAIFSAHGTVNITSCTFNNNTIANISANTSYGAVLSFVGGTININKTKISNSSSISGSGQIYGTVAGYSSATSVTLNIGTSGDNTSGCYFSSNASNGGLDLFGKQSGTNTLTINGYYTNFLSTVSTGNNNSVYFNNANGGTFTIANSGNPNSYNNNVTKTNTTAAPSFTTPTTPTYTGTCATAVVLPIELLYFKPYFEDGVVKIKWATASEYNNDYFTIEKSYDGINYECIYKTKGASNSTHIIEYYSEDRFIDSNVIYYRLKQTDFDGNYKKTNWESVNIGNNLDNFLIYPNPYSNNINIYFNSNIEKQETIYIYDLTGNLVYEKNVLIEKGSNFINLFLVDISKGFYVIQIDNIKNKLEHN